MWVDVLAMAAVGILAACIIYMMRRSLAKRGRSLPRWALPAIIGASMIGYSVWNEYTWFGRITSQLPPEVAVVGKGERSAAWSPWTYLWPVTTRFVALDTRNRVQSSERAGLVVTEILLVERWQPTRRVALAFDCQNHKRAELLGSARIEPDGALQGSQWQPVEPQDPVLRAACASKSV
ncbi:MAG TPA: hypothetical protein VKZ70_12035 [Burkholderiaceae bacterium]|nr:hypothetical protein [Burkholderiaceae bacterium]